MNSQQEQELSLDERFGRILAEWLEADEAGIAPDALDYLHRYPEFEVELKQFFADREKFPRIAVQNSPPKHAIAIPTSDSFSAEVVTSATGTLGDFRLLREVGRGGMGIVYEAEQISLGRRVALKVLPFAATLDPRQLQRFHNEARAAASLHHNHIVPVYAVGQERSVHFFAMQFIEGKTLADMIAQERRASEPARSEAPTVGPGTRPAADTEPIAAATTKQSRRDAAYYRQIAEWGIQAADALEHAHSLGIVHRDIKPGNLMIDAVGKLWVADFGLARRAAESDLTMTGDLLGTLRYMSPEQAQAKHDLVDHRSDIYSLGATLYEMLTLHFAVDGNDREAVLQQITQTDPTNPRKFDPRIPTDLETIVLKTIAKEPEARYGSAKELAEDLRRFLNHEPIRARRATLGQRLGKWARRHAIVVQAAAVVLFTTTVLAGISAYLVNSAYLEEAKHREIAETKERAAKADFERAEANAAKAHEAVERFLTRVGENRLVNTPHMEQIRRELLQDALQFYLGFLDERPNDKKRRHEVARAYLNIARIQLFLGNEELAQQAARKAEPLLYDLVFEQPDVVAFRYSKASLLALNIEFRNGRGGSFDWVATQALHELKRLASENPDVIQYALDRAELLGKLGARYTRPLQGRAASDYLTECLQSYEQLAARYPENLKCRQGVAMAYRQIADLLAEAKRDPEASVKYERAIAIQRKLVSERPDDPEIRGELARCCMNFSYVLSREGKEQQAETTIREAADHWTRLTFDFPHVPTYARFAVETHHTQGRHFERTGQWQKADVAFRHAISLLERSAAAKPRDIGLENQLAIYRAGQARFLCTCPDVKVRNVPAALQFAQKAVEPNPANHHHLRALALALFCSGKHQDAMDTLNKVQALRKGNVLGSIDIDWWLVKALVSHRLGDDAGTRTSFGTAIDLMGRHKRSSPYVKRLLIDSIDVLEIRDPKNLAKVPKEQLVAWQMVIAQADYFRLQAEGTLKDVAQFSGRVTSNQRESTHESKLQAGKTYVIDLESAAFDTILRIHDAQGKTLAENNDIGPNHRNSRLILTPEQDGVYRLVASAFDPNGAGPYTLTIRELVK